MTDLLERAGAASRAGRPFILKEGSYSSEDVQKLRDSCALWREGDVFAGQEEELFDHQHPELLFDADRTTELVRFRAERADRGANGDWIYFPWSGVLLHAVSEHEFLSLRTSRNRIMVTSEEQTILYDVVVVIAGLSIGSNIALSLALSGIARTLILCDFDALDTTNYNRVLAPIWNHGVHKAENVAERLYELNPYLDIHLVREGITTSSLEEVFATHQPHVIFDEMDDFEMKVRVRETARKFQVPVLMVTNLGDSLLFDVERYDESPPEPFNGLAGDAPQRILAGQLSRADGNRYAAQIVGIDNVPTRGLESLPEIGHTLGGRPQLGATVMTGSGIAAYLVRRLALGMPLPSGRARVALPSALGFEDNEWQPSERRERALERLGLK